MKNDAADRMVNCRAVFMAVPQLVMWCGVGVKKIKYLP